MRYYVVYFDFLIQKNNLRYSGRFGGYVYRIENSRLSVIYTKKKNRKPDIGYFFELDDNLFALLSMVSLVFGVRCSTSRTGYSYQNNITFDTLLNKKETGYHKLHGQLRNLKQLSRLEADHLPVGFDSSSAICFNSKSLVLAESLLSDITKGISDSFQQLKIFTQLDYWRRGFDLSRLGFTAEGFLNFFKICEHVLKDSERRRLTDDYIKLKLKQLNLANLTKKLCLYRDLRNSFNIGHYVQVAPRQNSYDEYLSNMSDWIWNHESDIAEVSKLLILRSMGLHKYYLKEDGGLFFVEKLN